MEAHQTAPSRPRPTCARTGAAPGSCLWSWADTLSAQVGSLDAVMLCAGHNVVTPFGRITVDEWNAVLEVNLGGAFFALLAMAPMIRRGGAIVTVASVAAQTGAPHHMHYAAAKAGLVASRSGRATGRSSTTTGTAATGRTRSSPSS
jgi:NAD(P)-dependent dehydrogenase (short-subunit alcohol dehydrogenase family)